LNLIFPKNNFAIERVVVLDFKAPKEYKYIAELFRIKLEGRLVKSRKFSVVERRDINKILEEQKLIATGYFDESTFGKVAHLLGADGIILGEIYSYKENIRDEYYDGMMVKGTVKKVECSIEGYVKLVDVQTGKIICIHNFREKVVDEIITDIKKFKFAETLIENSFTVPALQQIEQIFILNKDDSLSVDFEATSDVEIYIADIMEGYYPSTYKKAFNGYIRFEAPSWGYYKLVIKNPGLRPRKVYVCAQHLPLGEKTLKEIIAEYFVDVGMPYLSKGKKERVRELFKEVIKRLEQGESSLEDLEESFELLLTEEELEEIFRKLEMYKEEARLFEKKKLKTFMELREELIDTIIEGWTYF